MTVSTRPRTNWLPPGWTQGYRNNDQRRRKLYVAPAEKGSKVAFTRTEVEVIEGRKLFPMDQHGQALELEGCTRWTTTWPSWLPKDWQIGYFKSVDAVKVCFLNPDGERFADRRTVLESLKERPADVAQKKSKGPKAKMRRIPVLGSFANRMSIRHRTISSLSSHAFSAEELETNTDIFRTFTYAELQQCFAPPLGETTERPAHWPSDVEVCPWPRISWLPPGWGQALRVGEHGRHYKVYIPPAGHGCIEIKQKPSMETCF